MSFARKLSALVLAASLSLVSPQTASSQDCKIETAAPECNDGYALNGYWWYGFWVPGLVSLDSWFIGSPAHIIGNAVWYAPYMMEATAKFRELSLDGYVDGVSGLSCADIGNDVWLKRPGYDWEGPFRSVDCAQRNDLYGTIVWRNEVVEVGFETAERWGMVQRDGRGYRPLEWRIEAVEVSKLDPTHVRDEPVVLRDWFLQRVTYVDLPTFENEVELGWTHPRYEPESSWWLRGQWVSFEKATVEPTATMMPTATETVRPTPVVVTVTPVPPSPTPEPVMPTKQVVKEVSAAPEITGLIVLVMLIVAIGLVTIADLKRLGGKRGP